MARPVHDRKVQIPLRIKGFMPVGYYGSFKEEVILFIEECEAVRLLDYERLKQEEAAGIMEISRPTLTRIYESARQKIARAITEALPVRVEGGRGVYMDDWYLCSKCESKFNLYSGSGCPVCSGNDVHKIPET